MGYWKNRQIAEGEQGWRFIDDRFVCADCWDDYALKHVVRDNLAARKCSYCGRRGRRPLAAELNHILTVIGQGLRSEWSLAIDELFVDDGEYVGKTWDTAELFDEIGWPTQNEALMEDVIDAFDDNTWCEFDPFHSRPEEALALGWDEFKELVKTRSRFLFLMNRDDEPHLRGREEIAPADMLGALEGALKTAGLTSILPAGTGIWRARVHRKTETLRSARELGSPEHAKYSNRMSPAGIAMFYGAMERETAVAEVFDRLNKRQPVGTVATFTLNREIHVLNLAHLPPIPSLYDESQQRRRAAITFLHGFAEDLVQPVKSDAFEHIEYVPTQILTEFIRDHLLSPAGPYSGVLYRSARYNHGTNVCFFFDNDHCFDPLNKADESGVVLDPTSLGRFP
jgi:hypothetical protein